MEFKFRSVDDRPPPTAMAKMSFPSPTLGSCFIGGQEMPGGNSRLSSEPTGNSTGDHVQASIQREIEKERIRQEIIAAETAKRTELVAEVMREMATERELALQRGTEMGMPLEERLKMWINYRWSPYESLFKWQLPLPDPLKCTTPYNAFTSPMPQLQLQPHLFQQVPEAAAGATATPVVEPNKDKLIVLDRPDHNGAKCKAEASPVAGVGGLNLLGVKKKPKEDWGCSLCKVTATCERSLKEHLQGRKHKAKEAALRVKQMSKGSTKVKGKKKKSSSKLTCLKQIDGEKSIETEAGCKTNSEVSFGGFSKSVMQKHELREKHEAQTEEQSNHPEAASTSNSVGTASPVATTTADAIKVPPSNPVTKMVTHDVLLQEEKVKDKILEDAGLAVQTADKVVVVGTETARECMEKRKSKFWCEICNIWTQSKKVMQIHMLGRKHQARAQKRNQISAQEGKTEVQNAELGKLEDVAMEEVKEE